MSLTRHRAQRALPLAFTLSLLLVCLAQAADSLNVRLIGTCDTPGYANGIAADGSYAYVADFGAGLRVISVADPAHPVEVGYCDTPGMAFDVTVTGDHAYVADYSSGLRVISVADPAHPVEVGNCDTPPFAVGVTAEGG